VTDDRVYVDPLVMTISTAPRGAVLALDTMRAVHEEFPNAHLVAGLSNVSFGLPVRGLVNRTFLTLALAAGLDCAILDPLDRELRAALFATDMLLGRDAHCLNYLRAFRAGLLEPQK
jgi:5-methyltetrahydrofolate--homocysteine methyltransferase